MAKAYISTKKYKECIDLLSNKTEPELKDVLKEAFTLKENNEKLAKLTEEKLMMTSNEIREYFQLKGWKLLKRNEQLPHGVEVQFIEGVMSIPLIVVYPEFSQFDLIAKTGEEQKLSDSLQELFSSPLPWDSNGEYKEKDIEFFAEVEEAVLMKLPKDATIA